MTNHIPKETTIFFRFLNFATDHLIVGILFYVLGALCYEYRILVIENHEIKYYFLILLFFYYLIFESLTGRTLGKMLTGTMVVTYDFKKPNFSTILIRTLIRFIPLEHFTIFIYPWHDIWTKTKVVEVK
jgi:uncharacterized RDD family membrane protein YckC